MTPNSVPQTQAPHNVLPTPDQRQAPAYPLVTHDPYFSIWSCGDKINESPTLHWSGKPHALSGIIRVKINKYGLPLDSRSDYTKSDWILWTATLTENIDDFRIFADPVYKFAIETTDRVPLSDWHYTSRGKMEGFQARSVVGGFFIKLLKEQWKKEKFYKVLEREVF